MLCIVAHVGRLFDHRHSLHDLTYYNRLMEGAHNERRYGKPCVCFTQTSSGDRDVTRLILPNTYKDGFIVRSMTVDDQRTSYGMKSICFDQASFSLVMMLCGLFFTRSKRTL